MNSFSRVFLGDHACFPLTRVGAFALLAGLAIHFVAFNLILVKGISGRTQPLSPAFARYSDQGVIPIREQAELFDTAPLFFPTEWNYASDLANLSLVHPQGTLFASFSAEISFPRGSVERALPGVVSAFQSPVEALVEIDRAHFHSFGLRDVETVPVPRRSGFLEIREMLSGRTVERRAIETDTIRRLTSERVFWVGFQIIVDKTGIIGESLLYHSTVSEESDTAMRDYLRTPFLLAGLAPGYYEVIMGP